MEFQKFSGVIPPDPVPDSESAKVATLLIDTLNLYRQCPVPTCKTRLDTKIEKNVKNAKYVENENKHLKRDNMVHH